MKNFLIDGIEIGMVGQGTGDCNLNFLALLAVPAWAVEYPSLSDISILLQLFGHGLTLFCVCTLPPTVNYKLDIQHK